MQFIHLPAYQLDVGWANERSIKIQSSYHVPAEEIN